MNSSFCQCCLTPYVYARGLARDVDETVPSVSVVLHRMCTLEGLPEMSMKQFLLSVLSYNVYARGLARDVDETA